MRLIRVFATLALIAFATSSSAQTVIQSSQITDRLPNVVIEIDNASFDMAKCCPACNSPWGWYWSYATPPTDYLPLEGCPYHVKGEFFSTKRADGSDAIYVHWSGEKLMPSEAWAPSYWDAALYPYHLWWTKVIYEAYGYAPMSAVTLRGNTVISVNFDSATLTDGYVLQGCQACVPAGSWSGSFVVPSDSDFTNSSSERITGDQASSRTELCYDDTGNSLLCTYETRDTGLTETNSYSFSYASAILPFEGTIGPFVLDLDIACTQGVPHTLSCHYEASSSHTNRYGASSSRTVTVR